jgi:hypothetical protein
VFMGLKRIAQMYPCLLHLFTLCFCLSVLLLFFLATIHPCQAITQGANKGFQMTVANMIRKAIAKRFGYHTVGAGFEHVTHYSLTFKNAVEWAACYDAAIIWKNGQLVATKN